MKNKKTYLVQLEDSWKNGLVVEAASPYLAINEYLNKTSFYSDDYKKKIIVSELTNTELFKINAELKVEKI